MIEKIFLTNVFADGLFSGVQAGVVILRHLGQESFLQALATELSLPITVYILPNKGEFMVRYFNEEQEIKEGGYGIMAAGHIIYSCGLAPPDQPVQLHNRSGQGQPFRLLHQNNKWHVGMALQPVPIKAQALSEFNQNLPKLLGISPANPPTIFQLTAQHLIICGYHEKMLDILSSNSLEKLGLEVSALTLSAPLSDSTGYTTRTFTTTVAEAKALSITNLHATLVPYWAKILNISVLDFHHHSNRLCHGQAQISPTGEMTISGHVHTTFKADPVIDELLYDSLSSPI